MTISSAQTISLPILNDDTYLSDTITLTSDSFASLTTSSISTITLGGNGTGYTIHGGGTMQTSIPSISISDLNSSNFTFHVPAEWDGSFPDFHRIQKMCEQYPGLKIAFEKFKTVYKLVKDDYDTPKDKK